MGCQLITYADDAHVKMEAKVLAMYWSNWWHCILGYDPVGPAAFMGKIILHPKIRPVDQSENQG